LELTFAHSTASSTRHHLPTLASTVSGHHATTRPMLTALAAALLAAHFGPLLLHLTHSVLVASTALSAVIVEGEPADEETK
jgi:hypothetical protein